MRNALQELLGDKGEKQLNNPVNVVEWVFNAGFAVDRSEADSVVTRLG